MADSIYRATVFYTGKWGKNMPVGGSMFARAASAELAEPKFRMALNSQLVANGYPEDIYTLDIRVVSLEEVEEYFANKDKSGGGAMN